MPIWQLCANLLIPNCLRSNLSYSPLAALELYVKNTKKTSKQKILLRRFYEIVYLSVIFSVAVLILLATSARTQVITAYSLFCTYRLTFYFTSIVTGCCLLIGVT